MPPELAAACAKFEECDTTGMFDLAGCLGQADQLAAVGSVGDAQCDNLASAFLALEECLSTKDCTTLADANATPCQAENDAFNAIPQNVFDACLSGQAPAVCGDGVVGTGETCDDGNTADGDGCGSSCTICGDSIIDANERCDDGNATNGDGCSALCQIEVPAEWHCDASFFGSNDGCDCNCGVADPDCAGTAGVCEFCYDNNGSPTDCVSNPTGDGCNLAAFAPGTLTVPGATLSSDGVDSTLCPVAGQQQLFSVSVLISNGNFARDVAGDEAHVATSSLNGGAPIACTPTTTRVPGIGTLVRCRVCLATGASPTAVAMNVADNVGARTPAVCVPPGSGAPFPAHAPGGTADLFSCDSSTDCRAEAYCVHHDGDAVAYCKPSCATDQDCAAIAASFPGVRCNESFFADGVLSSTRVCNETFTQVLDFQAP